MKMLLFGVMGAMMAMNCAVASDDMTLGKLFEEGKYLRFTVLKEIIIGRDVIGMSRCVKEKKYIN